MRLRGRLAALVALAGVWLLASGPAAAAHGALASSEPAGGSSLERAPAAVTLRFTERPDPGLSSVRVLDSRGRVVAGGPAQPIAGRPEELRVPVAGLAAGGYTVSWRIVSAVDGHRTDGVFAFGSARPAPLGWRRPGGGRVPHRAGPVRTAVCRPLGLVLGLTCWSGGRHRPAGVRRPPARRPECSPLALAASAAGLVAMTPPPAPRRAFPGRHACLDHRPLAALARGPAGRRRRRHLVAPDPTPLARPRPGRAGGGGGGMLVMPSGHAAGPFVAAGPQPGAQWAHLLASGSGSVGWPGCWPGSGARPDGSAREVVVRFSKLAGISLAVVVATGVARTVDELGGWARLADSGFGRALDLKLVLFAGLVALGAFNRYRLVPLFEADVRRRAVGRLRRSVGGELGWPRGSGPRAAQPAGPWGAGRG